MGIAMRTAVRTATDECDPCAVTVQDGRLLLGGHDPVDLIVDRTPALRLRAWRLTYGQYRKVGLCGERVDGLWYSAFDLLPGTCCLMLTGQGGDRATITVVGDGPNGLAADALYADELDRLRARGDRLQELGSLASIERDPRLGSVRVLQLIRGCIAVAAATGRDGIVITIHPRHAPFYERCFGFVISGPERSYAKVGGAPAVLLHLDLRPTVARFAKRPPGSTAGLWRALREHPLIDPLASRLAPRMPPYIHHQHLEIA